MKSTINEEYLKMIVSKFMREQCENEYDIKLERNSGTTDGFMAQITFFKISFRTKTKTYHLVIKSLTGSEIVRKLNLLELCFERELYMYSTLIPNVKSFILNKNCDGCFFQFVPKFYWCSGEYLKEALVLEDVRHSGYKTLPMNKTLDLEHVKLVLRTLAEWHGVVMAYRDQNPSEFQKWIPDLSEIRYRLAVNQGAFIRFFPNFFKRIHNLLINRGYVGLATKYEKYEQTIEQYIQPTMDENDRLVITHGDCWVNNMMFEYKEDTKTPVGVKLLDYQYSTINTPVEDLSFFIYSSCDTTVLDEFDSLLSEYYSTVSTTIQKLGSKPQDLFTFEQLEEHWRKYGTFGVFLANISVRLQCLTEEEKPDLSNAAETDYIADIFDMELKNDDIFSERILNILLHYGNKYM